MKRFCLVGLAILVLPLVAQRAVGENAEDNWPQWRGPLQNGMAPYADPPTAWSETNNIKWKIRIPGDGSATPVVWENRIFVQTALPSGKKEEPAVKTATAGQSPALAADAAPSAAERRGPPGGSRGGRGGGGGEKPMEAQQFAVLCIDRQSGKTLWQKVAREEVPHEGYKEGDGSFAAHSGLTDGTLVFAYFGSHGIYAYDLDGNQKWSKDLGRMQIKMNFGEGNSPALYKDTLLINRDNENGSFILALDKKSGKELWKKTRDEGTTWSSPLVVEHNGKAQVVVSASGKIRSYDVTTGDVIWECAGLTQNVIPSPVADSEKVYCASGFRGNALLAIKLEAKGNVTDSDAIVWKHDKATPYVPSPLLYDGRIYFLASNNGRLSCLDTKDGKPLFEAEQLSDVPNIYASPIGAAGRIYVVGRNGVTVVLKNSGQLDKLAANKLDDKIDASPVAVGKDLVLRGRQNLYCIEEK